MAHSLRVGRGLTTAVYFSSLAFVGLTYGMSAPTLGALAAQTGVGLGTIGIILSARSLGYLLGASQLGRFVDRRGSHRFLAFTILVGACLVALIPVASRLWVLALLMGLTGVTLAAPDVGGNSLIMRLHPTRPGPYMNGLHLFFGVGALLAPLLVVLTRTETSIAWSYWILAIVVAVIATLFLFRPEPPLHPQPLHAEDREARSLLWFGCVVFAFYVGAEVGFSSWVYEYVNATWNPGLATQMTSGFWLAFTGFRLFGVLFALRFSPARVLFVSFGVGILSCAFLFLLGSTRAVLWGGVLLYGAGIAAIYPTLIVFLGQQMTMTGRRLGIVAVASTMGSMTIPWLVGRVFAAWSPRAVPMIAGTCLVLSLGLFVGLRQSVSRRCQG